MKTWDSELANIETASNVEIPPFKTAGPIDFRVDTIRSSLLPLLIIHKLLRLLDDFSGKSMLLQRDMYLHREM